jgi:hypothetical protein
MLQAPTGESAEGDGASPGRSVGRSERRVTAGRMTAGCQRPIG